MTPLQVSRMAFFWSISTFFLLLTIFQAFTEISGTFPPLPLFFEGAIVYVFLFFFLFVLSFELRENFHYVDPGKGGELKTYVVWGAIFFLVGISHGILKIILTRAYFSSNESWWKNNLYIDFINFMIFSTFIIVFGSLLIYRDDFGQQVYSLSLIDSRHDVRPFWTVFGINFISWVPFLLMHTISINFGLYLVFFIGFQLLSYGYTIFELSRVCVIPTPRHSLPLFLKIAYGLLMLPSFFGLFLDIFLGSMGLGLTFLFFQMMSILYASRKPMEPPVTPREFAFQSHIL